MEMDNSKDTGLKYSFQETYGLVLSGGNSSRMGVDKSLLQYYDKPQRYHVYNMLQPLCERVFISCNAIQSTNIEKGYSFLQDDDAYSNIGPMAGLVTAFKNFPGKHALLTGCDYPFLTAADLQQFSLHAAVEDKPVAFYNHQEDMYEPLLAWYPWQSYDKLKEIYKAGQFSLQRFLKDNDAVKFYPENKRSIISVDKVEDFIKVSDLIKERY